MAYTTIFPIMIPGYNLIVSMLLIFVLLLQLNTLVITKIGVVFLFSSSVFFIIYYKASLDAVSAYIVLFLLSFVVLNLRRKEVELFVKAYVNMIFIFAIASIVGFLILYIFPFGENICQQTIGFSQNGEFSQSEETLKSGNFRLYKFPCYLGLSEIRYGGSRYDQLVVDFNFFGGYSRSSSYSNEPTNAGFFMIPAFIMLLFSPKDKFSIKEKIKLYVILFSLAIVIVSFLGLITIFSLYILKKMINSRAYKYYLFIILFLMFFVGIFGADLLIYLKQSFDQNALPVIFRKLLVNSRYFNNLVYLGIPVYILAFWLIRITRSYVASGKYYSIYFLLSFLSYFVYMLKNPSGQIFSYFSVFTGFFQHPSFWLWCALYVCTLSIRFNKPYSY